MLTLLALNTTPALATYCTLYDPHPVTVVSCEGQEKVYLTPPSYTSGCYKPKLTGTVVESNGYPVKIGLYYNSVTLPIGEHVVEWKLTDKWGKVLDISYGDVVIEPGLLGNYSVDFNDRASTYDALASGGTTEIGADAESGDIYSNDDVWLRSRAVVDGDVFTGGIVDKQAGAYVTGYEFENLYPPPVPYFDLSDYGPKPGTTSIVVDAGKTKYLAPGSYGQIIVNSNGTLVLEPGDYGATEFILNSGAYLDADEYTRLFLSGSFTFRGVQKYWTPLTVELTGPWSLATIEKDFYGYVDNWYGKITLASGGYDFVGRFRGYDLLAMEDAYVVCEEKY